MTSEANKYQVGGSHYKTSYEHWDLVLNVGMGYFEGQASKYVARHSKKNGLEDLKKAPHYVVKLIESLTPVRAHRSRAPLPEHTYRAIRTEVVKFAKANALTERETDLVLLLSLWRTVDDLRDVVTRIQALSSKFTVYTVPASDSNKHAERSEADKTEDDFARHNEIAKSEKRT